ncbi:Lysine-specific histone demethylase 1-like protein 3 [Nymphaea thermarum]|nr:Lysine-specific histone demethylase 1-like protein 3 [Nymphaea thermarum]
MDGVGMRGFGSTKRKVEVVGLNDDSEDDNEPIGSIFNLKKKKRRKKKRKELIDSKKVGATFEARAGAEVDGPKGKAAVNEDANDRDDDEGLTLASFRKKLKDPKGSKAGGKDLVERPGLAKGSLHGARTGVIQSCSSSKSMEEDDDGGVQDADDDDVGLDQVLIGSLKVSHPGVGQESQTTLPETSEEGSLRGEEGLSQSAEESIEGSARMPAKRTRTSSRHRQSLEAPKSTNRPDGSPEDLLSEFVKAQRSRPPAMRKEEKRTVVPGQNWDRATERIRDGSSDSLVTKRHPVQKTHGESSTLGGVSPQLCDGLSGLTKEGSYKPNSSNIMDDLSSAQAVESIDAPTVEYTDEIHEDGNGQLNGDSKSEGDSSHKQVQSSPTLGAIHESINSDKPFDTKNSIEVSAASSGKLRPSYASREANMKPDGYSHNEASEDLLSSVFRRSRSGTKQRRVFKSSSAGAFTNQVSDSSCPKLSSVSNYLNGGNSLELSQPPHELMENLSSTQETDNMPSLPLGSTVKGVVSNVVSKATQFVNELVKISQADNEKNSASVTEERHCSAVTTQQTDVVLDDKDDIVVMSKDSDHIADSLLDNMPSKPVNTPCVASVEVRRKLPCPSSTPVSNGIMKCSTLTQNASLTEIQNPPEETIRSDSRRHGLSGDVGDEKYCSESGNQVIHKVSGTVCSEEICSDRAGKGLSKMAKKVSTSQRVTRKARKPRYGDMTYEGDSDWDSSVYQRGNSDSTLVMEDNAFVKTKTKADLLSTLLLEAHNGGVAAVAAGLKAKSLVPIEKIKFKEILKRRGGLHEYLECRNMILSLWSKDVCRILPLSDCGVTSDPLDDEPPRASLIRDIYAFLDSYGYINTGIASVKEIAKPDCMPQLKLSKRSDLTENSGGRAIDTEEEVAFILGQAKHFENVSNLKYDTQMKDDKCITVGDVEAADSHKLQVADIELESSTSKEMEEDKAGQVAMDKCILGSSAPCTPEVPTHEQIVMVKDSAVLGFAYGELCKFEMDEKENGFSGCMSPRRTKISPIDSVSIVDQNGEVDTLNPEQAKTSDATICDMDGHQRVIVIGAGPAGLTAARHLQRQGFMVNVLEARHRIGGRVHTDRSSLSVPVDLGASIITGVEADVATGRRPDPSSLLCTQLDLELTVLNSECPLYDIVTGEKVPSALDESLEAEYNSLLDDMEVLVSQNGEAALKLSLEDGLEHSLRSHRVARPTVDEVELHHLEISDDLENSIISRNTQADGSKIAAAFETTGMEIYKQDEDPLDPLERRVMNWHFAHLEYGCAASLDKVSLPYWNQDDVYGGFGGAHCMIRGGYSTIMESLAKGLNVHLNHVVSEVKYRVVDSKGSEARRNEVKVLTENGNEFVGDAVLVTVPLGCLKANAIKFSPSLPEWKQFSIQRLGFGVLNKVILEFPAVFWDDSVDYFGATAEKTDSRGQCFMFWNVRKTVGAPVLIALVVGKAAIDGQNETAAFHVKHAILVLRKLFGEAAVPDPVASVVTNWGQDPFSQGTYSYVAIGASGEDYDILARPVENCLFFAGEATCKEHPDTVGGAMLSGLREAVRIIDILRNSHDYAAEVEKMEAAQRQLDTERNEVRDMTKRLASSELFAPQIKILDGEQKLLTKESLLKDMFLTAKSTAGRLYLAKQLLQLPVKALKAFAGTKEGLSTILWARMQPNSCVIVYACFCLSPLIYWLSVCLHDWSLAQLINVCFRDRRFFSFDMHATGLPSTETIEANLSLSLSPGIGKTVKEKVVLHSSRDIRAVAGQLVNMWIEVFRREKSAHGWPKFSKQTSASDQPKNKDLITKKSMVKAKTDAPEMQGNLVVPSSTGSYSPAHGSNKKVESKLVKLESRAENSSTNMECRDLQDHDAVMSEEEAAAFAAAEAARAAALAAAEAYASSEASMPRELPKIPSFHKFARREQYAQRDELDPNRKWWAGSDVGKQDFTAEIDSRNCKVRNWSVDFSATCGNLEGSRMSAENAQLGFSNDVHLNFREHSGESGGVDSRLARAWVHSNRSTGGMDRHAIDRWQSQSLGSDMDLYLSHEPVIDEGYLSKELNMNTKPRSEVENSSASQAEESKGLENQQKGAEKIKQGLVDYIASLLMPLYKARKIDKEGYKSILKKSVTKVMEQSTEAEKLLTVSEFLEFRRKNKIRAFVDKLIERHMALVPLPKT